jgi:hypothetical protein
MAETREERQARIIKQYKDMSTLELDCARQGFIHIAGVDEAGRGPLAGPVYAACVIIDPRKPLYGVNDSKKLSEKCREALYDIIIEKAASYGSRLNFCFPPWLSGVSTGGKSYNPPEATTGLNRKKRRFYRKNRGILKL